MDGEFGEGVAVGWGEVDELDACFCAAGEDGALAGPSDGALDGECVV